MSAVSILQLARLERYLLIWTTNTGAHLIYLPPYSPDFNPIEEAFSAVKAWLQQHKGEYDSPENLPWLIHQAIDSVTPSNAIAWFRDCGYILDDGNYIEQ